MSNKALSYPEKEDTMFDLTLRPQRWEEYIGQELIKKNLRILIDAARKRNEPIEHVLFSGPAGLGKTTLAHLVAREMQSSIRITSGPTIERVGDLASVLTNMLPGDILFIDEAHRLNKSVEEMLYPAMESRHMDIIIGKGPSARTIQLELPPFTLIAATTRPGLLSSPLRSRFGALLHLDFYTQIEIEKILERSAKILGIKLEPPALQALARSSRATPRVANRLLKRARDYAEVSGADMVTKELACQTLNLLEIDELGLESMDRRLLEAIILKFNGGPVGLGSIAAACLEEEDTIQEVYEPYLLQLGLMERTPRGRVATQQAYNHLKINLPIKKSLFKNS